MMLRNASSGAVGAAALLLPGLAPLAIPAHALSATMSSHSQPTTVALANGPATAPASGKYWVYLGTYTGPKSKGIYRFQFDLSTGQAGEPELAAETASPSFLALHPKGKYLYAVNETEEFLGTKKTGGVTAFSMDAATGTLKQLNQQPSHGVWPCHLSLTKDGGHALVANYGTGTVAAFPVKGDGTLEAASSVVQHRGSSVDKARQEGPHAHCFSPDPEGKFFLAADLGLDKVLVYRLDREKGALTPNDPPSAPVAPGSGPRHVAFHPNGKNAYVINEMLCTITAFRYDGKAGTLSGLQTVSTLPAGVKPADFGNSTAELEVHPNGRWVYGSNRGHNSIAMYSVQGDTGMLTYLGNEPTGGKTPRNFAIDPTGKFLLAANQDSDTVTIFRINQDTGRLQATGQTIKAGAPVCVVFVPVP